MRDAGAFLVAAGFKLRQLFAEESLQVEFLG